MRRTLEWWPEYGKGPLWADGKSIDLTSLGLSAGLVERLVQWNAEYADEKLPVDGQGGDAWLKQGVVLLTEVRQLLGTDHRVIVTEPWWADAAPD